MSAHHLSLPACVSMGWRRGSQGGGLEQDADNASMPNLQLPKPPTLETGRWELGIDRVVSLFKIRDVANTQP
jgi:hypothetical protein